MGESKKVVKVLVWDLDETLWQGTLIEGDEVQLRPGALPAIQTLDERGILHSIASKNDFEMAMGKVRELGLQEYFLYPQVSWSPKSASVAKIAKAINIGLDAVALIDDQQFEREEVRHVHPEVLTLDASELAGLAERPEFIPRFITDESAMRRQMYQADSLRNRAEEDFQGPAEEFLAGLGMRFTISPPLDEDLKRAEELTVRTHQLNTTGYTYSFDELDALRHSADHLLLVADLQDKYGSYGKIGLALVEKRPRHWNIKLLLMSCRVMSRGVGTILINYVMQQAKEAGVGLQAEFKPNDRNRMMLVSYRFAGFRETARNGEVILFENELSRIQPFPDYVDVRLPESVA